MPPGNGQQEQDRQYITSLAFARPADSIDEARRSTQEIIASFENQGFTLLDGSVTREREEKPIEQFTFGASEPYRNLAAREETTEGAGMMTGSPR